MKIAILGAGFAGLATVWTLLRHQSFDITLFDKKLGSGASGIAAGLLHPYANVHAKLNRFGHEGFSASMELLLAAEKALGFRPFSDSGILRPALRPTQEEDFWQAAKNHPEDIQWLQAREMASYLPQLIQAPGILVKKGVTVFTEEYLKGLLFACQNRGAKFVESPIAHLDQFKGYDKVIITLGSGSKAFSELAHFPLRYTKGQILELEWPEGLPPLPMALNANIYCVMMPGNKKCLVGSTYEKNFASEKPDIETAIKEIIPKLTSLYPPLQAAKILSCRAGIRVSTPQHLPLLQQLDQKHLFLTGFGSKGLLYHGLYAKKACELLFSNSRL